MSEWIALSRSQHGDKHYLPRQGYTFAVNQAVAPILLAELPKLLPHYALGFIQQGEGYQPVALLSLDGQTNLYVAPNGKWIGNYVPASLRAYPFTLANNEQGEKILAIDAEYVSDDTGEPLFDEEGGIATPVAQALDFLKQCEQNRQVTQKAAKALQAAEVIEPWPLKIDRGEGQEPLTMKGLYRISESALNALEAEAYATLQGTPMALAHAQMLSTHNLHHLTERAKLHAEHGATQEVPENLDSVLDGMDDDDDLTFDFDS